MMRFAASVVVAALLAALSWTFAPSLIPAYAQTTVTVIGAVSAGTCVQFFSQTQVKDSGTNCGGGSNGFVKGPVSSGINDVPVFGNTIGSLLAENATFWRLYNQAVAPELRFQRDQILSSGTPVSNITSYGQNVSGTTITWSDIIGGPSDRTANSVNPGSEEGEIQLCRIDGATANECDFFDANGLNLWKYNHDVILKNGRGVQIFPQGTSSPPGTFVLSMSTASGADYLDHQAPAGGYQRFLIGPSNAGALPSHTPLKITSTFFVSIGATHNVDAANTVLSVAPNVSQLPAPPSDAIFQMGNADGHDTFATIDAFGTGKRSILQLRSARGTAGTPTATQSGDAVGSLYMAGRGATGYGQSNVALVGTATENWTDAAQGERLDVFTTVSGSTVTTVKMRVDSGVMIPSTVAGGDMGAGALNAALLYEAGKRAGTSASSPVTLNATTGVIACATCVTSSGGGAITGTAPISVSAAGVVSINAPYSTITSPVSGGVPYFNSTTTMASSALLTANAIVLGGGAATAPATLGSLGTTTTVLHGNASGAPSFASVTGSDMTNNTVGNAQIRQGVADSVIGVSGNATANVADIQATVSGSLLRLNSTTLGFGAVDITNPNTATANFTTWSPTIGSTVGTITTSSVSEARYIQIGKLVYYELRIVITTNGTGAGAVTFSLPVTSNGDTGNIGTGFNPVTGASVVARVGAVDSTHASILRYDGSYPAGDGSVLLVNGMMEAQ